MGNFRDELDDIMGVFQFWILDFGFLIWDTWRSRTFGKIGGKNA
jgi:hypothetical protein